MEYEIDAEVQSLLIPQTKEEFNTLEKLILDGLHVDPGVVCVIGETRVLGDGHNRRTVCLAHGLTFPTREKKFDSRSKMIQWVIDNQLGRRNLTEEWKSYYRGKEYLNTKKDVGRPDEESAKNTGKINGVTVTPLIGKTNDKLADKHGVSPTTINRDAKFAEAVDKIAANEGEKAKEEILNGTSGKTRKEIIQPKPAPKPEPTVKVDAFRNPLPKHCLAAYEDPWIQSAIDSLAVIENKLREQRLADGMAKRAKHYPFFIPRDFIDGVGFAQSYLDQLLQHLKTFRPAGVCPSCGGEKCAACKMSGLVPRELYAELKGKKK